MKRLLNKFSKKNIFYKTRINVMMISTIIVFLCLFIFAIITKILYTSRVFNSIDDQLMAQKKVVEDISRVHNDFMYPKKQAPMTPPIPPNFIVAIYKDNKAIYVRPNAYFDKDTLPSITDKALEKVIKLDANGYEFRGIIFEENNIKMEFLVNVDSELESINQLMTSIIISLIILSVIALVLSYFLSSRIIKPVKYAYDKQVFFVQDASHEMRTPLAVIRGRLEILTKSITKKDTEESYDNISKIMSEVRAMEKLNNDLLFLSKEDLDSDIKTKEIDLSKFIESISEFYFDLAEVQDKKFELSNKTNNVKVNWDYDKVKRSIIILLENAFKYTKADGEIILGVQELNKGIKITVKDNGIGIKEEDKARIFDRFFRSDDVRVQNISGSGIGLSLLSSISKSLGVKVKFISNYGQGTEFELLIPKNIK